MPRSILTDGMGTPTLGYHGAWADTPRPRDCTRCLGLHEVRGWREGDPVRSWRCWRRRGDRGAVAAEFALILPIFILLVFGAIQYGYFFFQWQQATFAAREGARIASVGFPALTCAQLVDQTRARVTTQALAGVSVDLTNIPDDGSLPGPNVGDTYTVTVDFPTALALGVVPVPSTVTQSAEIRIENVPGGVTFGGCDVDAGAAS